MFFIRQRCGFQQAAIPLVGHFAHHRGKSADPFPVFGRSRLALVLIGRSQEKRTHRSRKVRLDTTIFGVDRLGPLDSAFHSEEDLQTSIRRSKPPDLLAVGAPREVALH